jgi:large subunit ribosomal protein L31
MFSDSATEPRAQRRRGVLASFRRSVSRTHSSRPIMKSGIHPDYRDVVFLDVSNDFSFVTRSTVQTREKVTWKDGKDYPLFKLDTSSESHPFYTGAQTRLVEAGRVEKFRQKFAAKTEAVNAAAAQATAAAKSKRR